MRSLKVTIVAFTMPNLVRFALLLWIWGVASYDIFCCQWLTPDMELNPLARIVMVAGGLWLMVAFKVFGTFLATELLRHLSIWYSILVSVGMLILLLVLLGVIPVCTV